MSLRSNVLRAYRECVALARILPSQQCEKVLDEVRTGIRKHTDLPEGSAATDQLKALVARVGFADGSRTFVALACLPAQLELVPVLQVSFLRLSTPRSSLPSRSRLGHTHYVFRDGELVEGKGFAETKCAGPSSMHACFM